MSFNTEVKIYKSPDLVCAAVADEIARMTNESQQDQFHISLSGGTTPGLLFRILSENYEDLIPWKRIHFWWGDERCVAPDNDESNFKMANEIIFEKIKIPAENIHRIKGENNPDEEALRYSADIQKHLNYRGENPVFDLILLGIGSDGHTASIFPDQIELFEEARICVATKHPITGQSRITLTGKVLNNASKLFFLVTGKSKAQRISEIMNDEEAALLLPAYYISPKNGNLIWFLDEDAASRIL